MAIGIIWPVAFPLATIVSGAIGWGLHRFIYAPIQKKEISESGLLVSSIGLLVVLQNLISLIYGDEMHSLTTPLANRPIEILEASITPVQLIAVCSSVVLCASLWAFLRFTHRGLKLRAVGNDRAISRARGIDVDGVISGSFVIGSALGGAAGTLAALDTNLVPTMGMRPLLMGITAMVVGGIGSMQGTVIAALLIATVQHTGAWYFSARWQDAIAFLILLIVLILNPHGVAGPSARKLSI